MAYEDKFNDIFDVAFHLLDKTASNLGYCNKDGHLHDPSEDLRKNVGLFSDDFYRCTEYGCDKELEPDTVETARIYWSMFYQRLPGLYRRIREGKYRVFISDRKEEREIELIHKKSDRYRDEDEDAKVVLKSARDLKNLEDIPEEEE